MNENTKTLSFVGVGVLALAIGWWSNHRPVTKDVEVDKGTKLFANFSDPLEAKTLDIIQFDEATAALRPFQIAQVGGLWSIPSHQNYPSDARDHLAAAATSVMDLEILSKVSDSPGDQELYGVIDPDIKSLKPGMVGVGTRVTLKNEKGDPLADFIIGKEVKDQPGLRYVRRAGKDQIFTVAVKTDKLSTKFEDWIEKDLLQFNPLDLRQVQLNDYSIEEQLDQEGGLGLGNVQRSKLQLAYDEEKSAWNLVDYIQFEKGKAVPSELAEDEELNTEKLNGLKSALDDLKIADVERKPKGLSQDLRVSEEFIKNREAVNSLASRGYYPVKMPDDRIDVLSSEGEVIARMKDGVQYVLRFGQSTAGEAKEEKDEKGAKDGKDEKDSKNSHLNRYLFVSAKFDPEMVPKPKLEELPGSEQPADEQQPAAGKEEDPAKTPETKTSQKSDAKAATKGDSKKGDDKKATEPAKPTDAPKAEEKPKAEEPPKVEKTAGEKAKDEQAAKEKRELAEKNNKRKQEDYDSKLKKGEEHVKNLNERFADWYYVISDETYRKIHLGRTDVVKKKEKPAGAGDSVGDLKELEKGLKGSKK